MTHDDSRRVSYLPLDDLKPDPKNSKEHDFEVIDQSIGRFGVIDLIVRDERTGYTVSGHGRTQALKAMRDRGESAPEGVVVSETGEWLVPVVTGWASRTDAEASAALIAMNRTTELGGWVDEALLDLLGELDETPGGFDGVGFGEDDLEDLRATIEESFAGDDEFFGDLGIDFDDSGMTGLRSFVLTMSTEAFVWAQGKLEEIASGRAGESNTTAFLEVLAGAEGEQLPGWVREAAAPNDQRLDVETFEAEEQGE